MNKPIPPEDMHRDAAPAEAPRDVARRDAEARDPHRPAHDVLDLKAPDRGDAKAGGREDGATEQRGPESRKQDSKRKPGEDGQHNRDKEKSDEPPPKAPPKIVFIGVGLVLLACLAWGAYSHWRSYSESKQTVSDTLTRPVEVRTLAAQREDGPMDMNLPGETDAFDTASIYARATGYISERRVDIGSRVKQGDLLLHIAAPDLDNQLVQAVAQLGQTQAALAQAHTQVTQAQANVNLAKVTFARTNQLTQQGYESLQNRDQQQANVQTSEAAVQAAEAGVNLADANVKAQQATIDRLRALTSFEDVRAPFDGVITSRNVDKGDLVNADTSSGSPMFTIARDNIIRVTIRVPQNAATGILEGLEAVVHVPQMPNRAFTGRVARTSGALLYSSRSLTAEVDVPNSDGALRSGLYVVVDFKLPREHPNVSVPAESLIFNQLGMQVATVEDGKAKMHGVTIFRDHGTSVELRDGLQGGERVVLSPPATLADNSVVKEIKEEDSKKNDGKGQKPDGGTDKQGQDGEKQANNAGQAK